MASMRENLVKKLMASTKCAVCGWHYEAGGISVLGHEDDLWFLTVSCSACDTRYLVAAVVKDESVPEAVTDLTEAKMGRFEMAKVVTADDVLNMHDFLSSFDGDFPRLFERGGLE